MDRWVLASLQSLIEFVRKEMDGYRLYTVVPRLVRFIDELTNWYVRLNRDRIKGRKNDTEDCRAALCTLYEVLFALARLMGPVTPFFAEYQYQNLRLFHQDMENENVPVDAPGRADSVHYLMIPEANAAMKDEEIEKQVELMQTIINLGRTLRERRTISLKMPVRKLVIVHTDTAVLQRAQALERYVKSELNVMQVEVTSDEKAWCLLSAIPDQKRLGKRLGRAMGKVMAAIKALTHDEIVRFKAEGRIEIEGHELSSDDLIIKKHFQGDAVKYEADSSADGSLLVALDTEEDDEMKAKCLAREVVNAVQSMRKAAGLGLSDKVDVFYRVLKQPKRKQKTKPSKAAGAAKGKENTKKGKKGKKGKKNATPPPPPPAPGKIMEVAWVEAALRTEAGAITAVLGCPIIPIDQRSKDSALVGEGPETVDMLKRGSKEDVVVGVKLEITLTRRTPVFDRERLNALCAAAAGGKVPAPELALDVETFICAMDPKALRGRVCNGKLAVAITPDLKTGPLSLKLEENKDFWISASARASAQ
jgi:hypothetical protein